MVIMAVEKLDFLKLFKMQLSGCLNSHFFSRKWSEFEDFGALKTPMIPVEQRESKKWCFNDAPFWRKKWTGSLHRSAYADGTNTRVNPRPQVLTGKFPVFFFPKCLVFSVLLCYGIHSWLFWRLGGATKATNLTIRKWSFGVSKSWFFDISQNSNFPMVKIATFRWSKWRLFEVSWPFKKPRIPVKQREFKKWQF